MLIIFGSEIPHSLSSAVQLKPPWLANSCCRRPSECRFCLLLPARTLASLYTDIVRFPPCALQGRLDLFFLLLAGLMAANLALYLWVAANYEYKAVEHVKRVTLPRAQRQVGGDLLVGKEGVHGERVMLQRGSTR